MRKARFREGLACVALLIQCGELVFEAQWGKEVTLEYLLHLVFGGVVAFHVNNRQKGGQIGQRDDYSVDVSHGLPVKVRNHKYSFLYGACREEAVDSRIGGAFTGVVPGFFTVEYYGSIWIPFLNGPPGVKRA